MKNLLVFVLIFFALQTSVSQTFTFTPAGATGQTGPSQTQINATYLSTNLNGSVIVTGGIQSWTVPVSGVYRIETYGAKGGNAAANGGLGARMRGDFNLTAGQVLKILVGQSGQNGTNHGGGGGGTYVTTSSNGPLCIAGAGGGAYYQNSSVGAALLMNGVISTTGNGGVNAFNGTMYSLGGTAGSGGGVGPLNPGQPQGSAGGGLFSNGASGFGTTGGLSFINGGTGGNALNLTTGQAGNGGFGGGGGADWSVWTGAGGGGGYSGGGSGYYWGCGGGGGSFNSGINQSNTSSVNNGTGYVVITTLLRIIQTSVILCNGQTTAILTASATGTSPYTYSWSPGGSTSQTLTGLGVGTYTCRVIDAASAIYSSTFTVTQPPILFSALTSPTNVTCNGGANGALTVLASGGTGPYTYTWIPSGGNAASASALVAGSYTCSIKDNNNCPIIQQTATITQPAAFSISASAINSVICNTFSTALNGSGATTYTWTGGVTNSTPIFPSSTTAYTATGFNALGCVSSNVAVVSVAVNPLPTISVNSGSICNGQTFIMMPTGASTYTYQGGSASVSPAANTSYTVVGTSSLGCISSNTALSSVTVNAVPVVSVNTGTICTGQSFTIVPGGASTYIYLNGGPIVSPLINTSYSVTGTSAQGCVSSNTAVSNVVVNITPTVSVNSGAICTGQSFTMIPTGANTYSYSSGSPVVSPIINTTYSITGTSAQGCVSNNTAVSNVTVNITPTISVNSGTLCSGNSFTLVPTGAFAYVYSSGNAVVAPLTNAVYFVSGTSIEGCVASNTAVSTVTVFTSPVITVNNGIICSGNTFTMIPAGASSYTYSSVSATVSPVTNTSYSVVGSNSLGCISNTAVSSVTVNITPTLSVNSGSICNGQTFTIIPFGAASYSISGGSTTVTPATSTAYTITGISSEGCAASNTVISSVTVFVTPTLAVNSGTICSGQSFTILPTGASSYTFSNGSAVATPTSNTNYSVTGTSSDGCTSQAVISTVTVYALPSVNVVSVLSTICIGESNTLIASGAASYSWSTASSSPDVVISPTATSIYSVVGTSIDGCTSTSTVSQRVDLCTGIAAYAISINSGISIFPNPNNGRFELLLPDLINVTVEIYTPLGQRIIYLSQVSSGTSLNLTDFNNGAYYLRVIKNNKVIITQKVVKQ